jgi:hypothetical protein
MSKAMKRAIAAVRSAGEIRREERVVAGHAGAVVWLIASLSVIAMALALPSPQAHRHTVVVMGIAGCAWGGFSGTFLDYRRLPAWLIHLSAMAGVVSIAIAISLSGGGHSPAWACLFYVVVFAAYFFKPPAAAAYFLACVAADAVALVGGAAGVDAQGTATLVVAAPAFIVLGVAIVVGKRFLFRVRRRAERLAAEQGALRRVATAVVSGEPADRFYQLVAVEAGKLLSAGAAAILRMDTTDQAAVLGLGAIDRPHLPGRQRVHGGARFRPGPGPGGRALGARGRGVRGLEPGPPRLRVEHRHPDPGRRTDLGLPGRGVNRRRGLHL